MKGGEGCFLVITLVIICISDTCVNKMKGEGFFSFRFSNFQLFYPQIPQPYSVVKIK